MLKRKTAFLDGRAESLDTKSPILLHVSYEIDHEGEICEALDASSDTN